MSKTIRLIWDFRGPTSQGTAEHYEIHLKEFMQQKGLIAKACGSELLSEMHSIAFVHIEEADLPLFKQELRPHRGEYAS